MYSAFGKAAVVQAARLITKQYAPFTHVLQSTIRFYGTAAPKQKNAHRIRKLLVANRGEIACRVIRTAKK